MSMKIYQQKLAVLPGFLTISQYFSSILSICLSPSIYPALYVSKYTENIVPSPATDFRLTYPLCLVTISCAR